MTHSLTSNNQKEAEHKRKPPSKPISCTTTGRSAANSLLNASKLAARASERELSASSREAPQAWHFGLALV